MGRRVIAVIHAIVRFAYRRRIAVPCAVVLLALVSVAGIRRLSFDSDVLSLLPQEGRVINAFRTFVARFGGLDQLYVIFTAPASHSIGEYDDEVNAWVAALREIPEIERVDAGVVDETRDFSVLADRQLLLLPPAALDEALSRFTPDGMPRAVAARRELLSVPSVEVAALIRQDPLGLFELLRDALGGAQAGLHVAKGSEGYVSPDRQARLVIAKPRQPAFDATFARALDARLTALRARRTASQPSTESAGGEVLTPVLVEFAGGHRIAVETEAVIKRESISSSILSLALILPLLFVAFRSLWLVLVGSIPSALSLVLVLGGLGFAGVRLSAAAAGSAGMLFGLGVDGVVLLYVAHRLGLSRGAVTDSPSSIEGPSVSMLLGMFTTAATFYGLALVDFPSLRQLGLLIGHSMVICGVLTLVLVPALLPRRRPKLAQGAFVMPRLASWIVARRAPLLWGTAVATVILGIAGLRLTVDPTLDRLRSTTAAARMEERIGPMFGLPSEVYVVLAEGTNLQELLEANERLAARLTTDVPGLKFEPASRLLPSAAAQVRSMARVREAGLSVTEVAASLERARAVAGFTPSAFAPFLDRLPAIIHPSAPLSYDDYQAHGLGDLVGRFVVRDGHRWLLATYVFPSTEAEVAEVQTVVDAVDPSQTLTGLPLVNNDLARRFFPAFIKGLAIGSLVVVLMVVLTFRDARLSFFALLPTVVGLVWTAGILAIAGVELDLFAIFAIVTFVGIGVDYGVHLVHRYQERGDAAQATAELAPVILVAALITMFGYATLMMSSYAPLRSIGVVSTVSVVALAASSLLMLPSLLSRLSPR